MIIYIVRHGQSVSNKDLVHQSSLTPLSNAGVEQARLVAEKLCDYPITLILASMYTRARHTAEIIRDRIHKPLKVTSLLNERKRPSIIEGKAHNDLEAIKIREEIIKNIHDPNWHYSDEETFLDLLQRAQTFLESLFSYQQEHILIVSHDHFIKVMVGVMLFSDMFSSSSYLAVNRFFVLENTGICIFEYNKKWRMRSWNDHGHLHRARIY